MAFFGNVLDLQKFLFFTKKDIVFDYLLNAISTDNEVSNRIQNLSIGDNFIYYLDEEIFCMEQMFLTKNINECYFESHKKYVDLQLVIEGEEIIEYNHISNMDIESDYNINSDLIKYRTVSDTSKLLLKHNMMAVFFPEDAHLALEKNHESKVVRKVVVKVPYIYFMDTMNKIK